MRRRTLIAALALLPAGLALPALAQEQRAVCANCQRGWAGWDNQIAQIKAETGIVVETDGRSAEQAIAALAETKDARNVDLVYLDGPSAIAAQRAGVLAPYQPAGFDQVPANLKDGGGHWVTIHSGTFGMIVNKTALGARPSPSRWRDLLKPDYKDMIAYPDPTATIAGQVGLLAVNLALGGTYEELEPGIRFFKALAANGGRIIARSSADRVTSAEIPILLDYDFAAYGAQYGSSNAMVSFVIPDEGTLSFPFAVGLVAGGPNPDNGRKVIDYLLSDKAQAMWAEAYLRPVRPSVMTTETAARFLTASDYGRAAPLDLAAMDAARPRIAERFRAEMK